MSAYIVEDQTINIFLTYVADQRDLDWLRGKIKEAGYDLTKSSGRQTFGRALASMNRDAVNARYREAEKVEAFKLAVVDRPLAQVLKSLSCFLYQCSEGDVPNRPLFKLVELIEYRLLQQFFHKSAEFNAAKWG